MACSVSKSSNLTASLRAKKLQPNFPRFCQTKLTNKFILRKLTKLIKMQKKLRCGYRCALLIDICYRNPMFGK